MRSVNGTLQKQVEEARQIERNILRGTATICSSAFGRACKGIWPIKTAEELASRMGCSVRAAAYQISGEQEPTARAVQVLINEFLPRR